jgi:hypothetical protein
VAERPWGFESLRPHLNGSKQHHEVRKPCKRAPRARGGGAHAGAASPRVSAPAAAAGRDALSRGPDIPDTDVNLNRLAAPLSDIRLAGREFERWWGLEQALHRRPTLLQHRLLGHIRSPNGGRFCWERTQRRLGAWRHLFTIGFDYRIGFEVADGGRVQIAIPPGDLRRGRFDRACGIFDSA